MISLLSRISTTFVAGVDKTVAQIENHDALVDASLKQTRRAAAKARARLARLERDHQSLQQRIQKNQANVKQWTKRAKELYAKDRDRALQCLQRRNELLASLELDEQALQKHQQVEQQLRDNVKTIESRIEEVSRHRNQMRTRESAAQAQSIINELDRVGAIAPSSDLENVFERWDERITEHEIVAGTSPLDSGVDSLEAQFIKEEARAQLEQDLEALVGDDSTDSDDIKPQVEDHE